MPEMFRDTLDFLRDLEANNNKQWFDENRKRGDVARGHFEALVTELISSLADIEDLKGVTAKDCIFRLNRDIRFSNDKSPYKTNLGAVIGPGGRKSTGRSYYVQIAPNGHSMVAGGIHSPTGQELEKVRRRIANDSAAFKKIIHSADFVRYFGSLHGESLKTAPQGYPKDHPDIELLRFKQYVADHAISDEQVLSPELTTHVVNICKALRPFVDYLQSALDV